MSTQRKKIPVQVGNSVHFDDRTALHLTQAFNQEESLESLLALVLSQLMALCGAQGMNYRNDRLQLEVDLGRHALHQAEYKLAVQEQDLGSITIYFPRRRNDQEVQTCEDLLSLAFTALRNRIDVAQLRAEPVQAKPAELASEDRADALILIALDGYEQMKASAGIEWSQVLMTSVHTQVKEGLRQADGVYQISDDRIAVLLPNTTSDQASEVASKIRVLVSSLHLSSGASDEQLTASMGISDARLANSAEEVMENAKVALSHAQRLGGNSILSYQQDMAEG